MINGLLSGCAPSETVSMRNEASDNLIQFHSNSVDHGSIVATTYGTVALTDKGAYFIEQHGAGFVSLMYSDFSTQRKFLFVLTPVVHITRMPALLIFLFKWTMHIPELCH